MSHGDYDAFDYLDLLTGRLVEPRIGGPGYHEYRAAQAQVRADYKTLIGNRTVWGAAGVLSARHGDQYRVRPGETLMADVTDERIRNWFTVRELDVDSRADVAELNELARQLATKIRDVTPASVDQELAFLAVRQAVDLAQRAILCGGM
jgi:hypothetical protein